MNVVEKDFGIEAFRMLAETFHQFGALYAHCVRRPVVDFCRGHELSTLCHSRDEYRVEIGASGIHRSGISGRAGTEDDKARVSASHSFEVSKVI